jgi:hypothetical protein
MEAPPLEPLPTFSVETMSRRASLGARWAFGLLIALSLFLYVSPLVPLLPLLFPALAFLCGAYVYARSKSSYVSLVLWMWFLTPFVHRLVDARVGSEQTILLAPYLVGAISGVHLLRNLYLLAQPEMLPFTCALSAIFYGLCIGSVQFGPTLVATVLCEWLVPVLFAIFLFSATYEQEEIRRSFINTFGWAVLITGAYGLYQFFTAPSWDMTWLQSNVDELASIGSPERMEFRVFSTMNSTQVFGLAMMVGLLLLPAWNKALRIPAAMIGFIALLLTASRSAWVGFAAGAVFLFAYADRRQRQRLTLQFAACALLLLVVLRVPMLGTFIADRFRNFNDIQSDASYDDRVQGYKEAVNTILHEPFGEGLGSAAALHTGEIIGPHDSSFLESFYSLGWIGTLIYLGGVGLAGIRTFRQAGDSQPEMIRVGRAVIIAFIIQSPLNSVMLAQAGFFLWAVVALTMKEISMCRPAYEYSSWQTAPEISRG